MHAVRVFLSTCTFLSCWLAMAEAVTISSVPTPLPRNTGLGNYSPYISLHYSGLQSGKVYTMKVWLLERTSYNCASSNWCERAFAVDNSNGNNSSGDIELVQNMDVFDYPTFDWVVRLYAPDQSQVAFVEQYGSGTSNRPPLLTAVGDVVVGVDKPMTLQVLASDPEAGSLTYTARSLPDGAHLNSETGLLDWTPGETGEYPVIFEVTDNVGLKNAKTGLITVTELPTILTQPDGQVVARRSNVTISVLAEGPGPLSYQWQRDGEDIPGATVASLHLTNVGLRLAGVYRVVVSGPTGTVESADALITIARKTSQKRSSRESIRHLRAEMDLYHQTIDVYTDISSGGNHFHARGQLPDESSDVTIEGASTDSPRSGATCIRCTYTPQETDDFGGFYFLNGILVDGVPLPYFGEATVPGTDIAVSASTGLDLSGARTLTFWARGAQGGERIEFFMGGVGHDVETPEDTAPFADSTRRIPASSRVTVLTKQWKRYSIRLGRANLSNVMGGFGWVASSQNNPDGAVFYLDDIAYNLSGKAKRSRLNQPRFIRSFATLAHQPDLADDDASDDLDLVLRNTAFLYDNSLAILAFLADGSRDSIRRARLIGDAMVYAAANDRTYTDGRLRTAYSSGDLALPPGWEPNGRQYTTTMPGYYDEESGLFYEVENVDIDTGNNAWAMIALLALYNETKATAYLETAKGLGDFILTCRGETGLYQGFLGGIANAETAEAALRPYASTEHNLDLFAGFTALCDATEDDEWYQAAEHARKFVEDMWDSERGVYLAGTAGDPNRRNSTTGQIPLDTQSWTMLSILDTLDRHPALMTTSESFHLTTKDGFFGFDFNDDKDGVWFEGTAQMAVAYAAAGDQTMTNRLLSTLQAAQQISSPYGNGRGLVATSSNGLSTGFNFKFYRRLHLGATSWNIFAQSGFNPFYQTSVK